MSETKKEPYLYYLTPKFELHGNKYIVTIPRSCYLNGDYHVEFSDPLGDWLASLGFEADYKEMENFDKVNKSDRYKETLSSVAKFRRYQKRVKYTKEEFENLFELPVI
jgi:hypothetical protein